MTRSRRAFLGMVAGGFVTLGVGGCGVGLRTTQTGELLRSRLPLPEPYRVPLPVPPVKEPSRTEAGTDYYSVVQREALAEIIPGYQTPILGYDGIFPGPTIRSRSGRPTVVSHVNELRVPTVVHLHGGHTPPEHDGYPIDLVFPVGSEGAHSSSAHAAFELGDTSEGRREHVYPMRQRAATLWYHDHRMDFTGPQVYRGLAGFHLVGDDEEQALPLPSGERDVPLMVVDRAFAEDGSFAYPSLDPSLTGVPGVEQKFMEGVLGDVVLVNGAPWPVLDVDAARYRFRVLNASNARRYRFALDPVPGEGPPFTQIGSDGGLLEQPVQHEEIAAAPAERFDVVVDFARYPVGTEIDLVNRIGHGTTSRVMRFRVARKAKDDTRIPPRLSEITPLTREQAVRTREWRFERNFIEKHGKPGWTVNGKPFDPYRMDARPRLGDVEIWRLSTDVHHPVHVHLDSFQVLARNGREPGPYDVGWKDTVDIKPAEFVDVAVRFGSYTGKYLIHCHNLEHEDMMMMAAFETVGR